MICTNCNVENDYRNEYCVNCNLPLYQKNNIANNPNQNINQNSHASYNNDPQHSNTQENQQQYGNPQANQPNNTFNYYYPNHYSNIPYPYKEKIVAGLLCFFFGIFGAHRFYVGKTGTGLLYVFTCGLFGIGWFVDIILIISGSFTDSNGVPLI